MSFFTKPISYSLRLAARSADAPQQLFSQGAFEVFKHAPRPPHSSHPDFGHLTALVIEAVLEVVFVSLPGYIVARSGMFDAESQKMVANLNVMVFLPCLIFIKLASQLTADKLADLAIIPAIFVAQTVISWGCAQVVAKICRFDKRPKNFLTAMAVFGNSNSLPISLVISLAKTISGLHWDAIPGDNDDEVASRGILYLLIFQQLGQLVRWTWGYNILLKPRSAYEGEEAEARPQQIEEGAMSRSQDTETSDIHTEERTLADSGHLDSGERTPMNHKNRIDSSGASSRDEEAGTSNKKPANGHVDPHQHDGAADEDDEDEASGLLSGKSKDETSRIRQKWHALRDSVKSAFRRLGHRTSTTANKLFTRLPVPLQKFLAQAARLAARFARGVWAFMNPPLWAMLAAILVASIPRLQFIFFTKGSFVHNTFTRGISQTAGVAVPLILVVLGANLARNTVPRPDETSDPAGAREDARIEKRLLVASIVSRMVLPILFMAPLLAVAAKYLNISILDDPIFVIVCFLLTGAPSALQLAQICQINNVYMGAMAKLLFQEYVIWILPSTLVLVMLALEVVEWAHP